jgi:adenylate cyclase
VSTPFLAAVAGNRRELAGVLGVSTVIGAATGAAITGGTTRGVVQGALSGALVSLFVRAAGTAASMSGLGRRRFAVYVAATSLVTAAAICVGLAVAALPWLLTKGGEGWRTYLIPFLVAVAASIAFTWWFALDRLLGGGVLVGLLTGRYHEPRREARVFLFADLQRSTALAERLGELRYHSFLNRVFVDVARPVERHSGVIYQYVGDEVVVTWPLEEGLRDWRCLRCAVAISDTLRDLAEEYEQEFTAVPRFRFAVHCGVVVAGEIGDLRREIVYSGETVNTAARIEALAKETERELVASEDVLRHAAPLPPELTAESLGAHRLRGRERPLELFSVVRR